MENLYSNELIERYLSGSLSPSELHEVETRLATDTAFREEVELHRQLHEEFADPKKLQLRDLMTNILKEPPPPQSANFIWLKGGGIALLVLLLGWLGWRWFSPALENTQAPVQDEIKPASPSNEPIATPNAPPSPSEPIEQKPIAKADPVAYAVNRDFENRLGSMIRSSDGTAEMTSPAMGADFKSENGVVKINFRGSVPADADTAQFPLVLKVYDNHAASGNSLFRILPTISNRNAANRTWTFSSSQRLRLRPGLYYFTLERQANEDLIFVGKFTVGTR